MTRFWTFAPLYDAVTDTGGGAAPITDADHDAGGDDSLAEHEASFGTEARRQPTEPKPDAEPEQAADTRERDKDGKFTKPRHRARSQQATAEDVPRIQELTRKHREAEERATAAERRAEEAERRITERRETREEPPAPKPVAKATFPTFEDYIAQPGKEQTDWYAYQDARAEWLYDQRRAAERAEEAKTAAERDFRTLSDTYSANVEKTRKELPDYDAVLASIGPRDVSLVVQRATMMVGARAAYYLASHLDELRELTADTLMTADTPGFAAAVAATKRYLARLVAPEQRSQPSRTAAGTTGAARASTPTLAPKPPTLVRTGASRDAEDLPGDDASLADHEKAFGQRRRA